MLSELDLRQEIIKLLRIHSEQLLAYEREAIERKRRLSYRHFRKLESMVEQKGFLSKALQVRRQHLQMQRFKVRLQQKQTELILRQAAELKALKVRWRMAKMGK